MNKTKYMMLMLIGAFALPICITIFSQPVAGVTSGWKHSKWGSGDVIAFGNKPDFIKDSVHGE